jgi:hypothetical protein
VIRQAISCDICATEKRQTNHWFVAYEQAGELRVSGWNSRYKLRQGAKHLCGQTCLHKLVDEYMAKSIASRSKRAVGEAEAESAPATDTSLTSGSAYADFDSSARLITPIEPMRPTPAKPGLAVRSQQPEVVTMPLRPRAEIRIEERIEDRSGDIAPLPDEPPRYASRSWHAEAWERERERESRATEKRADVTARRRTTR